MKKSERKGKRVDLRDPNEIQVDAVGGGDFALDEVEEWNREDASDLVRSTTGTASITVSARDWTIETMIQQIRQGNIDLDPEFQRRNAWKDPLRSASASPQIL